MNLDALTRPPFSLDADGIAWVRRTLDGLSTTQKLQQLFVLQQLTDEPAAAIERMAHRPAGLHRRWGADLEAGWKTTRAALEHAEIPPFITGDLEGGGYGAPCQTPLPNAMGTAAMGDLQLTGQVAGVVAAEGRAMGFNWNFGPVVDIAHHPESAIVGTRSFGSDPHTITAQALVCTQVFQAHGMAATAKHWPGEGFDRRDQHLVTTVNPLSWDEWMASFGAIYRRLIDGGVMSVMAGHIAWPEGARRLAPATGRNAWQPATVSHELLGTLLRKELAFNGLVVSDATSMAGFGSWAAREAMVPALVQAGCDVLLFSRDPQQDLRFLERGLSRGLLGEERVNAAVARVLGLKAALGLHRLGIDERLAPLETLREQLRCPPHMDIAERAAAASVTLVKDTGLLPLDRARHRRVVIASLGIELPGAATGAPLATLLQGLAERGFECRPYDAEHPPTRADTDLVLYLLARESAMGHSHIEVDWARLHGGIKNGMRRSWHEVPTAMVSFGHPAYLLDAPRMPVYVNAYSATEPAQRAVLRRLLGDDPFTGISPIDAFCGQEEARW